jgi:hypothetical protein
MEAGSLITMQEVYSILCPSGKCNCWSSSIGLTTIFATVWIVQLWFATQFLRAYNFVYKTIYGNISGWFLRQSKIASLLLPGEATKEGEWLKRWANPILATEVAEFFEKNLKFSGGSGTPWHRTPGRCAPP